MFPQFALLLSARPAIFIAAVAWFSLVAPQAVWGQAEPAEAPVDFAAEILPILSDKCFACHGPDTSEEVDLRLDSFETATADRGGYRAINVDQPEESEFLLRIESEDNPMPPADAEKQLSDEEKKLLRRWIEEGGQYDQHWAFVTPSKLASLGEISIDSTNAIDAFIDCKLEQNNLKRAPEAERSILARRAALTLTGLPPEPEQLAAFLADQRTDAYEHFVDQLLASSRYGEHMARFWLDSVRYGDTHGLHLDNRRGIYPYRDWVVRSFNENLPLDDFIVWQLAGDLLPGATLEQKIATGFVRLNPTTSEGGAIPEEFQAKNNFDRTETLGTVLLGMTLTCARCHTHKYDPITQTEYYQLFAFFNNTSESAMDGNAYAFGPHVSVPADQAAWSQWEELTDEAARIIDEAKTIASNTTDSSDGITGKDLAALPVQEALALIAATENRFASTPLAENAARCLDGLKQAEAKFTTTLIAEDLPQPRETKLLRRGEYDLPVGEPLIPNVPEIMGPLPEDAPKNRLGLAEWLTSPQHPLVSRVIANRLWQQVFGLGLVRTPEDFGVQGRQPTHPLLLDWLAVELQESGWDMKHMIRMMITSETFKQSSVRRSDVDDPENLLWARGPRYRLDAEVLRDMGLWASHLLDPTMGGEGVKPYQPAGMWKAMAHPASNTKEYVRDEGERLYRRSLYVYWKRTSPHPMMTLFDAPDRESSCVRRSRSSTPLQSLAMFNETQRVEMGRKFGERLVADFDSDEERLEALFQLVACRPPSERELQACRQLLANLSERYQADTAAANELLQVGDAPRREDLPAAEVAAWTQVCITVLASDIAILLY